MTLVTRSLIFIFYIFCLQTTHSQQDRDREIIMYYEIQRYIYLKTEMMSIQSLELVKNGTIVIREQQYFEP